MYHQVAVLPKHKYYVSPEMFCAQVEWLRKNNFHSLRLDECDKPIDKKSVLITLDDGHISNLEAAQILSDIGFSAVFYIIKDWSMDNPEYLNPDHLLKIHEMGHELGVHGKDHSAWTKLSDEEFVDGMCETREWLYGITGESVIGCSAPGGFVRERERLLLKKNIPELRYIRSSIPSWNRFGDPFQCAMPVRFNTKLKQFAGICNLSKVEYAKELSVYWAKEAVKRIMNR